ncbi:MAG: YdeI/OmpD-associated family protein [Planctomycetales bacterium]|nr:YdeI/OmpD-associated family protein [Planctomycetales bacterium]
MSESNTKVDAYYRKCKTWQKELAVLRSIAIACGLTEEFKWRVPVYTFQEGNVVGISSLKNCCTISFFKGILLKDASGILTKPGENTHAGRVIRFTSVDQIKRLESTLKSYIIEAIEVEKSGLKVTPDRTALELPLEFQCRLDNNPGLKAAFESLTPGRQRGYILHFSQPKQSKTRESRIDNCEQRIMDGFGIHDCTCGLSQRFPACDGSHKSIR